MKNPFLDFSSIFWLIAELFIASFLCLIPIVKNGVLNEHTLTQGIIIAGIFLILSEFFRRFFRQLWQPFFLLTFLILSIIINPILCAIFFLIYLLFQAEESKRIITTIFIFVSIFPQYIFTAGEKNKEAQTLSSFPPSIVVGEKSKEAHTLSSSIVSMIIFIFIVLSVVVSAFYGMITSNFEFFDKLIDLIQIPLAVVIAYYFGVRYISKKE